MTSRFIGVLVFACLLNEARADIVDRIAIAVNKRIIKDSDIDLDVRITAFLNNQPLAITPVTRKESAQRLIDQVTIRDEIARGDYEAAPIAEAQGMLASLKKAHYPNDSTYRAVLQSYGVSEEDLKEKLYWQVTVLHFIEQRFRPAVLVTDEEIKAYYDSHRGQSGTLEALHDSISDTITEERVNKLLFDWLARRRKTDKIVYREEGLQ